MMFAALLLLAAPLQGAAPVAEGRLGDVQVVTAPIFSAGEEEKETLSRGARKRAAKKAQAEARRLAAQAAASSGAAAPAAAGGDRMETRRCYECGQVGHLAADCPKKVKKEGDQKDKI